MTSVKDKHEHRKAGFVDSLLNADKVESIVGAGVMDSSDQEKIQVSRVCEDITSGMDHISESMLNIFFSYWICICMYVPLCVCGINQGKGSNSSLGRMELCGGLCDEAHD